MGKATIAIVMAVPVFLWVLPAVLAGEARDVPQIPKTLTCMPAYPYFCANIHVGCAGRSRIPAPVLTLTRKDQALHIDVQDGTTWQADATGSEDLVIKLDAQNSYLRLASDGRYNIRIYRNGRAWMSHGRCR